VDLQFVSFKSNQQNMSAVVGQFTTMARDILSVYNDALSASRADSSRLFAVLFDGSVTQMPQRLLRAADNIGNSWKWSDAVVGGAHLCASHGHILKLVGSGKFQLVAPLCLVLALVIIFATLQTKSDAPVSEPPVINLSSPAYVRAAQDGQATQMKQFAAEKVRVTKFFYWCYSLIFHVVLGSFYQRQ
jgi:hypothetical protein